MSLPKSTDIISATKAVANALEHAAPGAAEAMLAKVNLLATIAEKSVIPKVTSHLPAEFAPESKLLLQIMQRKAPVGFRQADLGNDASAMVGLERFRTKVVSVAPDTWLGRTFTNSAKHVGRLNSLAGEDFGSAAVLQDGYVLTADHCISRGTNRLPMQYGFQSAPFSPVRSNTMRMSELKLADGRTLSTELVAYNPDKDIAMLKIHGDSQLPGLKIAEKIPEGRPRAAAIGYPVSREFEQSSISPGTFLSGADKSMPNHTQFALRTYGGYSGGPIVGESEIIGMVSRGNISQDVGITYSPMLEDIKELFRIARSQKPGSGVVRVSKNEITGEPTISHEPVYNWTTESEYGLHDSGKGIDPKIFELGSQSTPHFRKGPLSKAEAVEINQL